MAVGCEVDLSEDLEYLKLNRGDLPQGPFEQGQFAELSLGRVNYKLHRHGAEPRPLAVCIHGLGGCLSSFGALAQELSSGGFDVLTFDLYGFGLSDLPRGKFTAALFVRQVMELVAAIGVPDDAPLFLVGFSMGGLIAMEAAREHPERVRRILLVAPAGLLRLSFKQRGGISALRAARAMRLPAASMLAKLSCGWEVRAEAFEPDVESVQKRTEVARKNASRFRTDPEKYTKAWLKCVRDLRLSGSGELYADLAASGAEVMFIWGDSDCTVPLQEVQEELRSHFPRAPVLVIRGVGHGLLVEHSPTVARYTVRWFAFGAAGMKA